MNTLRSKLLKEMKLKMKCFLKAIVLLSLVFNKKDFSLSKHKFYRQEMMGKTTMKRETLI